MDESEDYWEDMASLDGVDLSFLDDLNAVPTGDDSHQQILAVQSPRSVHDADESHLHMQAAQMKSPTSPRSTQEPILSPSSSCCHQHSVRSSTMAPSVTSTDSNSGDTRLTAATEEQMIAGVRDLNRHMAYIPISVVYVPSLPLRYILLPHASQTHSTPGARRSAVGSRKN